LKSLAFDGGKSMNKHAADGEDPPTTTAPKMPFPQFEVIRKDQASPFTS